MPAWRAPRGKPVTSHNPSGWTSCCIRPEAAAPGRRRHPADNSSPRQPTAPDPLRVMPECRTSEPDSDPPGPPAETHRSVGHAPRAWGLALPEGMTVGSSVLKAVLGAGPRPSRGRRRPRAEAGGGDLAQQADDDAPDTHQLIATSGAGPLAVGAVRRRLVLVALAGVLVVALAGAGPLGPGALAALLVMIGASSGGRCAGRRWCVGGRGRRPVD